MLLVEFFISAIFLITWFLATAFILIVITIVSMLFFAPGLSPIIMFVLWLILYGLAMVAFFWNFSHGDPITFLVGFILYGGITTAALGIIGTLCTLVGIVLSTLGDIFGIEIPWWTISGATLPLILLIILATISIKMRRDKRKWQS